MTDSTTTKKGDTRRPPSPKVGVHLETPQNVTGEAVCKSCLGGCDCWVCDGDEPYCQTCDGTNTCGRCDGEGLEPKLGQS